MGSDALNRLFKYLCAAVFFFAVVQFFLHPPFWNRMDDATNLILANQWDNQSLVQVLKLHSANELKGWGVFRPVYTVFIYFYYAMFQSPVAAYGVYMIFILLLCVGWAIFSEKPFLFLLFCFGFSPHMQLFVYLSLQEKFIALAGLALLVSLCAYSSKPQSIWPPLGILASFVFGFLSKSTSIYLAAPAIVWLGLDGLQTKRKKSFVLIGAILILVGLFGWFSLSIRSAYTAKYNLFAVAENFARLDKKTIVYILFSLLVAVLSVARGSFRKEELVWPAGFLAYAVVMSPWPGGMTGYFLTGASFFFIGCMVLFVSKVLDTRPFQAPLLKGVISVALIAFLINRSFPFHRMMVTRSAERDIAAWVHNKMVDNQSEKPVFAMPLNCSEACGSIPYFAGVPQVFQPVTPDLFLIHEPGKPAFLITVGECPPDGFTHLAPEPVFQKGDWRIFERRF